MKYRRLIYGEEEKVVAMSQRALARQEAGRRFLGRRLAELGSAVSPP